MSTSRTNTCSYCLVRRDRARSGAAECGGGTMCAGMFGMRLIFGAAPVGFALSDLHGLLHRERMAGADEAVRARFGDSRREAVAGAVRRRGEAARAARDRHVVRRVVAELPGEQRAAGDYDA